MNLISAKMYFPGESENSAAENELPQSAENESEKPVEKKPLTLLQKIRQALQDWSNADYEQSLIDDTKV